MKIPRGTYNGAGIYFIRYRKDKKVLNLRIFLIEQKITENDINQLCRNRLM